MRHHAAFTEHDIKVSQLKSLCWVHEEEVQREMWKGGGKGGKGRLPGLELGLAWDSTQERPWPGRSMAMQQ